MQLKLFLLLLLPMQLFATVNQVNGTVMDAGSHKPVAGARVFINRSMVYSVTDEIGKFIITDSLLLPEELVVSMPGYETMVYQVNEGKSNLLVRFELVKKSAEHYTIDSSKIHQYQQLFLSHFLGSTYNTAETLVTNPEVLQYNFDEATGTLSVKSSVMLQIINDGLGYMIHYQLDTFSLILIKNISNFRGYCFFTPLKTQKPFILSKWDMHRQLAYNGSMLHFMRALKKNTAPDEGFIIRKVVRILETENGYKSALKSKYLVRSGSISGRGIQTAYAEIVDQKPLTSANMGKTDSANQTYFHYSQPLLVEWVDKAPKTFLGSEEIPQMISLLTFGNDPLQVFENGLYFDATDLFVMGFMQEKISDLLPIEYVKL